MRKMENQIKEKERLADMFGQRNNQHTSSLQIHGTNQIYARLDYKYNWPNQ